MAICQLMVMNYLHGWGRYGREFVRGDLETGIQYCRDLMEFHNLTHEPHHGYSLSAFIEWAKRKMTETSHA